MSRFIFLCCLIIGFAFAYPAFIESSTQCTTAADCPCSYCMNDASKKPPYLCHDPLPGVCCTKDSDCPGSYCVNYHGPPPYHCHASPSASDDEIMSELAKRGYHISAVDLKEFLSPAAVHVHQNGVEVPVVNASGINPADIWQIGKTLWQLVNDNKPSENLTDAWAGAVPKGISDWTALVGWQQYTSEPYTISFVNAIGMKLTEFDWVFSFKHHGAINGTGLFVTEAGVSINKAYAFLSEHLDVQVVAFKPLNYGSTTDPIAGLDLQIKLQSAGKFEKTEVGCHVTVKGDGSLKEITCDKGKHRC